MMKKLFISILLIMTLLITFSTTITSQSNSGVLTGNYIYVNTPEDDIIDEIGVQFYFDSEENRYELYLGRIAYDWDFDYWYFEGDVLTVSWGLYEIQKTDKSVKRFNKEYQLYNLVIYEIGHHPDTPGFTDEDSEMNLYFTNNIFYNGRWESGYILLDDDRNDGETYINGAYGWDD